MYGAKVVCDSLSPANTRLSTLEVRIWRPLLAEFNTHRVLVRNSASSRAIPIKKTCQLVLTEPAMPVFWGKNQAGMQAQVELEGWRRLLAEGTVRALSKVCARTVQFLSWLGVHKQIANRYIEPFLVQTIIVSATDWDNFFWLRTHKSTQPEFQVVARAMYEALQASTPKKLRVGEWHLPYIYDEDRQAAWEMARASHREYTFGTTVFSVAQQILQKVSAGRCARVSYLTHDGRRDLKEDIKLYDKLMAGLYTDEPIHSSPTEHVAMALAEPVRSGNFVGFQQLRKTIPGEAGPTKFIRHW